MTIILASSSKFRQQILNKLKLPFLSISPNIDETQKDNEDPQDLVLRLAIAKAKSVTKKNSLVIGSDQVATLDNLIFGKPIDHNNAVKQLCLFSQKMVTIYTGLCLYNTETHKIQTKIASFKIHFRKLSLAEIENYLQKEKPYNCAGSFKSEGLGIALFEKLIGNDPNTLMGLPLIELLKMLQKENINPLQI